MATENQIVIAAEVTDEASDYHQLHPMIAAANTTLAQADIDTPIGQLLADAGYCGNNNLAALSDDDPDCFIATCNRHRNPTSRNGSRGPLRKAASLVDRMDRKVSTKAGRGIYSKRQHMIEPVFGQIKQACGARRFMRRGKTAAVSEWKLLSATHNLLKLYRHTVIQAVSQAPPAARAAA